MIIQRNNKRYVPKTWFPHDDQKPYTLLFCRRPVAAQLLQHLAILLLLNGIPAMTLTTMIYITAKQWPVLGLNPPVYPTSSEHHSQHGLPTTLQGVQSGKDDSSYDRTRTTQSQASYIAYGNTIFESGTPQRNQFITASSINHEPAMLLLAVLPVIAYSLDKTKTDHHLIVKKHHQTRVKKPR